MPLYDGIGVIAEKHAIVLDVGNAWTKLGYAGEAAPRAFVRTPQLAQLKNADQSCLNEQLIAFVHHLYFECLLVNPKDRRVVLVESLIGETNLKTELIQVLFKYFEVLSVLLAPSHLMPLYGLGVRNALVIDVGFKETTLIPVYDNVPILKAWQAMPLGVEAVHRALHEDLLMRGTAKICQEGDFEKMSSLKMDLTDEVIEDIRVRLCFVTDFARGQVIQQIMQDASEVSGLSSFLKKSVPAVIYPINGDTLVRVDGQTRESACEVLFQQDGDLASVSTMVLDCLLQCPIDTRRELAQNMIFVGGGSMITGFKARLFQELQHLVQLERYKDKIFDLSFRLHQTLGQPNYAVWSGASLFGATDSISTKSFTKEAFLRDNYIPDWSDLRSTEDRQG